MLDAINNARLVRGSIRKGHHTSERGSGTIDDVGMHLNIEKTDPRPEGAQRVGRAPTTDQELARAALRFVRVP